MRNKYDPYFWKDPAFLKRVREGLGKSQEALANESGLSRSVIANYESGRTNLSSLDDALAIYRPLQAMEALGVVYLASLKHAGPQEPGGATRAMRALLDLQIQSRRQSLLQLEKKIEALQAAREETTRWLSKDEAERANLDKKANWQQPESDGTIKRQ
jgi:transcriptional regulator with XRE-family HTH domain